jgi:TonB-linked SusC/RagA family outer membrane protein
VLSGTVANATTLRPVEAAQLSVVGTRRGTTTDAIGRFVLHLQDMSGENVTLEVRRIGYRTVSVKARIGDRTLRIPLSETAIQLDEVVVTGTPGATEKRALGNAVGTVYTAKVLDNMPITDVHQLLNGRVAGVSILPGQGNAGTGSLLRVRGAVSLSLNNGPLVYVDGIRVDANSRAGPNIRNGRYVSRLDDLNPEDIEKIEVIKGPAAATLYGTEASRGVIQIITRSGPVGPAKLDMTVKQGTSWFMNAADRMPWNYLLDSRGVLDSVNVYRQELERGTPIFQNGRAQSLGLNLRGGTETVRYYLSTNVDRETGIVSYNWRNRLTGNASLEVLPTQALNVKSHVGFVHGNARLGQAADMWGIMEQISLSSPIRRDTRGFLRATPEVVAQVESLDGIDRFIGSTEIKHQPLEWLNQRLVLGADVGTENSSILFPRDARGASGPFGSLSEGDKLVEQRNVRYATMDYTVNGIFDATAKLRATTSLGVQYYYKRTAFSSAQGHGFPDASVVVLAGAATTTASEDRIETKAGGVFAQEQLGLSNRLFLTAALRADDHSTFGSNFNFVIYPKFAASWVVNEEPFWKVPVISALKLRAAWGKAGQAPDAYAAERTYAPASGEREVSTLTPQNLGNPDLKPERGVELELGFDAGLFEDRGTVGFTWYDQHTRDAIVPRSANPSLGFPGTQLVNVARVRSWGFELQGDARILNRNSISAALGFTLSRNDSRVESLGGLPPITIGRTVNSPAQQSREGYPIAAYFRKRIASASFDAKGELVNVLCEGGPASNYQPVSCDEAEDLYMGRPVPRWEGSLHTRVSIGSNLTVSGLIDFKTGHVGDEGNISGRLANGLAHVIVARTDPIALAYRNVIVPMVADNTALGFFDMGFAKLREISTTYSLPAALTRRIGAARAAITVSGRNLATLWTAQKYVFGERVLDPETRAGSGPGDTASELNTFTRYVFPQTAQVATTLRVTF